MTPPGNNIRQITRFGFYILAVLPIFIFRDFTPDNELRYLSIADEALQNGTIITFTNHGLIYADKPPLYLWIVMFGKVIFGTHSLLFLAIFSFIPALVVVYVMDNWVKKFLTESERFVGQLLLLTSSYYLGTAIVLRMDMLMCMFIVLSLHTFYRIYSGAVKKSDTFLFPLFVFLALFSKGPIGIIVPLFSTITFLVIKKKIGSIGKYWGLKTALILVTLSGVWFAGVYVEGGSQYLNNLLFYQTINRAINSFHHQEPLYFYLVTIWYALAPWSLFLAGILVAGYRKKIKMTDIELFFMTVALNTLVILSIFSSKLAVYMLPAFPFIVYLSVLWMKRIELPKWMLLLTGIPAVILCLALPGIYIIPGFANIGDPDSNPIVFIAALTLSISGIAGLKYLVKSEINNGIIVMGSGILVAVFVISFAIPQYNSLIGLKELCNHAKEVSAQKGVANYYYCEMSRGDNLDVYLGVVPNKLLIKDLFDTSQIRKPAILFLWQKAIDLNDSIQVFIKDRPVYRTGSYSCFEIE